MLPDPSLSCGKATSFFVGRVSTMVFDGTSSAQSQSKLKRCPRKSSVAIMPDFIDFGQKQQSFGGASKRNPYAADQLAHLFFLHIPSILASDFIECVCDLAEAGYFDSFH